MSPRISVIIPVLNEEEHIADVIAATRRAGECEIIVCDGGSTDQTIIRANDADLVLQTKPGRAAQMNAGAAEATGRVLLFLHADCRLSEGFHQAILSALTDPKVVGGCFQQSIDNKRPIYRGIEWGNAQRVHWLGWIYGDQGLFIKRELFAKLHGFPPVPLMEDLYLSKQLHRHGRLTVLPGPLMVDARRWEKTGPIRLTLRNWSFIVLAHLGVSLDQLASCYGHVRRH
ncbi:MAG: TIGR04283 family arsenosugar biosynthesis glycosyltransferase [Planctomycetaceae bacterium]|nr:TIGR04283 family arsenosugar biosynthesis glycosyltransferase [Planctomycetaceae bacterium]